MIMGTGMTGGGGTGNISTSLGPTTSGQYSATGPSYPRYTNIDVLSKQEKFNYCVEWLRPHLTPATYAKMIDELQSIIELEKMVK